MFYRQVTQILGYLDTVKNESASVIIITGQCDVWASGNRRKNNTEEAYDMA
jgi:hypothetical protein